MNSPPEWLAPAPAAEWRRASWTQGLDLRWPGEGGLLLPCEPGCGWAAWPDGNRSALLDQPRVHHCGRDWLVGVKGIGAIEPMFGAGRGQPGHAQRHFSMDCWFGEAPWGAQGEEGATTALALSEQAAGHELYGMPICPLLGLARLPRQTEHRPAMYHGYKGESWQEHRLMPSRVRLGDQAACTLTHHTTQALEQLGVVGLPALDAFIDRLLRTGLAALLLPWCSLRRGPGGYAALAWEHVWLDKDGVLATDGSLCFADLEGIDQVLVADRAAAERRARRHYFAHLYEVLLAVDRLLTQVELKRDRPLGPGERRAELQLRVELALQADPRIHARPHQDGFDLAAHASAWPDDPLILPLLSA